MSTLNKIGGHLIVTVAILLMFHGCKTNPECSDPVTYEIPFQGFGTNVEGDNFTLQNVDENQTNVALVIGNSADFQKYISCINFPEIDFNESFVLAGRTKRPACAYMKDQTLSLKCDQLQYNIEIEDMLCQKPTDVFYIVIVSKEYFKYPVKFSITLSNN
ncbi:MAG: hypothetical protein RBT74_16675 [Tenuifilaceae bacterium]|jgi:hypothetical protein|nr:hypothetical protein [Tenuifilaceae bacterium]